MVFFLFVLSGWIALFLAELAHAFRARRARVNRTPPRCEQCGYDIRGLPTPICPECGSDLRIIGTRRGNSRPVNSLCRALLLLVTVIALFPLSVMGIGHRYFERSLDDTRLLIRGTQEHPDCVELSVLGDRLKGGPLHIHEVRVLRASGSMLPVSADDIVVSSERLPTRAELERGIQRFLQESTPDEVSDGAALMQRLLYIHSDAGFGTGLLRTNLPDESPSGRWQTHSCGMNASPYLPWYSWLAILPGWLILCSLAWLILFRALPKLGAASRPTAPK